MEELGGSREEVKRKWGGNGMKPEIKRKYKGNG